MSVVLKLETKNKIIGDFAELINAGIDAANAKKTLAGQYNVSIKTVRKLTSNATKSLLTKPVNKKTYIYTAWELRVGIDKKFIQLLKQVADYYNAKVFIKLLNDDDLPFFQAAAKKALMNIDDYKGTFHIIDDDDILNENIQFKNVQTAATALSPIAGWENVFEKSTVIGGLVKDLKTEKTLTLCKQVMSTGSIGKLNAKYSDYSLVDSEHAKDFERRWKAVSKPSKAYHIAKEFIEPCALIIDVLDSKTFFPRYISKKKDSYLYDRNLKFTVGKSKPEIIKPETLVIGDFHSIETCPKNLKAIEEIANDFKPKSAVLNDFVSFNSINRYEWDDFAKVIKAPTLADERTDANKSLDFIESLFPKIYYLQSNHCNFLSKFLADETKYKLNIHNYREALDLRLWTLDTHRHPIIKFLNLDARKKVQFISENHDLTVAGIFIKHGHEGLAGAKAGFRAMAKAYSYKYIQGHLHTLEIFRNSAMCGTSSKLKLDYTKGPSNWLNAHLLVYEDGAIQNITVIDGVWGG